MCDSCTATKHGYTRVHMYYVREVYQTSCEFPDIYQSIFDRLPIVVGDRGIHSYMLE